MEVVVQRVRRARIEVAGQSVARMRAGLLALVGVARGDSSEDAFEMARKVLNLRIFPDENERMNRSLLETGGTLGVVSQFTLLGDCRKGRRPFFGAAEDPARAEPLVEAFAARARALGAPVVTGQFGASMQIELLADGPVTLRLVSRPQR